jgi:filamentous hemagglutinin family protein
MKTRRKFTPRFALLKFAAFAAIFGVARGLRANPAGLSVASGSASAVASGPTLNVMASSGAVLNWQSFNINAGETTIFQQPSASSVVLNQINGQSPSQIWGNLQANGIVILENSSGFYFGPNAVVRAPGFVATTAAITPQDFGSGAFWQFTGPPPQAKIVNYGQINAGKGGSVFLIAEQIENHGSIIAPGGSVGLVSGQQVFLSDRPDGRGLSAQVNLPAGSIDNNGRIVADAGTVALNAQVVNQNGLIKADSVREQNGVIELFASDQLNLGANSQILARGGGAGPSSGGSVTLKSGNDFSDATGSEIDTSGGAQGGNGGNVEISAPNILSLDTAMNAGAQTGYAGGQLLLDPTEIMIGTTGTGTIPGSGTVTAGSSTGTLTLNVNSSFQGFSQITLEASDSITFANNTSWNLSASTGVTSGQLVLEAGNNIVFGNNSSVTTPTIYDTGNWSVSLEAGVNFTTGTVQAGKGSIFLNGGTGLNQNGAIRTAAGSISLTAGQDILIGSGFVNTTQGGGILADALSGNVNAGTVKGGYTLSSSGYSVPNGTAVGGFATINGGDVTLEAGNSVISTPAVPTAPANQTLGASGAYGSQPGDVTVIAGNQILGSFLVRNGTGSLEAGVSVQNGSVTQILNPAANIGSLTAPVTLSLISGNWDAWAANDVFVAEVLNPNGIFNSNPVKVPVGVYPGNIDSFGNITPPPVTQAFLYDYAQNSGATFWAGNAITLGSANLVRISGGLPISQAIYPPQLSLTAGAGGITIANNNIVLFPSPEGSLNITTSDGGNLSGTFVGGSLGLLGIIMSDSGLPNFRTFGGFPSTIGYAVTPLHLNDPNLVTLDILGGIETLNLSVPTAATITAGSIYNFNFTGHNVSSSGPTSVTTINVAGDIDYRGNLTTEPLNDPLPAELLNPALIPANTDDQNAINNLIYNSTAGTISFIGKMNSAEEAFLLDPTAVDGTPIVLSATQQSAITALFAASQTASTADVGGLNLNGPGLLKITANNMDLGISGGINVNSGVTPLPSLTAITPYGASLDVTLTGNLEMTTTEIMNGGLLGNIQLNVGGQIDVGAQSGVFADPNQARGIFTTSSGNVSVTAGGDVNVDGSRIAAYDGGNVTVASQQGDVNAGSGGTGAVSINEVLQLDANGQLESFPGIAAYGSGIMATTVAPSSVAVGNITVSAPNGNINADVGGIEQVAFNHITRPGNFIELDAGGNIDAGNSGVIGSNIRATAGGSISGVFVGSGNVNINAVNDFTGTIVGSSSVAVNAGGTISGTIVGGESISVSGTSIDASLVSGSVSASGDTSSASIGPPASNVQKVDTTVADTASAATSENDGGDSDDEKRKKGAAKNTLLASASSRVTVIFPAEK